MTRRAVSFLDLLPPPDPRIGETTQAQAHLSEAIAGWSKAHELTLAEEIDALANVFGDHLRRRARLAIKIEREGRRRAKPPPRPSPGAKCMLAHGASVTFCPCKECRAAVVRHEETAR